MPTCITCGQELPPERAEKYDYCTAPGCQQENLRGLPMVAVGVNKAADQYEVLDERTREDMASGRYQDQRRASYGGSPSSPRSGAPVDEDAAEPADRRAQPPRRSEPRRQAKSRRQSARARRAGNQNSRHPWTASQERLALLYSERGIRPAEIAEKLGLSTYTVTQILLASKNRGKL